MGNNKVIPSMTRGCRWWWRPKKVCQKVAISE